MRKKTDKTVWTDAQYVKGLKEQDNRIVQDFFYIEIRSVLEDIQITLFHHMIDYCELVNELYLYLQQNNWRKLDTFAGVNNASLRTWISTVAWRYFLNIHGRMPNMLSNEDEELAVLKETAENQSIEIIMDVKSVLSRMKNRRYADALVLLLIDGYTPSEVARMWGTTVDNIYNIKLRALDEFVALYGGVRKRKKCNKGKP